MLDGIIKKNIELLQDPNFINLNKSAIDMADAIIIGSEKIHPELEKHIKDVKKPTLEYQSMDEYVDAYASFYDELLLEESVLAE